MSAPARTATGPKRATRYDIDIIATRGAILESRHRVHAAVVNARGELVGAAGDPTLVTSWRSCAKPMQAAAVLAAGIVAEVGWGVDELALTCASHGGEPEHVTIAARMLESVGLEEGDLACGPHDPLSKRASKLLKETGERPSRLHNNCSGKHASMLAHAVRRNLGVLGYQRAEHPVQQAALEMVSHWTGVDARKIPVAIDGCGATTFGLPLEAMAIAFARFGASARRGDEIPRAVFDAMQSRPFLVGGTERFDTVLIEETNGALIAKVGAEGVHCVAIPDAELGVALKVEDGGQRAQYAAVVRLLQLLDVLNEDLPGRLAAFARNALFNTRGEAVGEIAPLA